MSDKIERDELGIEKKCENCDSNYYNPFWNWEDGCVIGRSGLSFGCSEHKKPCFCPSKKALKARIEDLQKENAKLKENIEILKKAVFVNQDDSIDELDVGKLVKPLKWKQEKDRGPDYFAFVGNLRLWIFWDEYADGYYFNLKNDKEFYTVKEAQDYAQQWLVDFVRSACKGGKE